MGHSVLHSAGHRILEAALAAGRARPGDWGVMAALGPGFAAEGALLRW